MKTYDRNRNAIATGSMVMIAGNGTTGVIKAIHGEGKTAEQLRRQIEAQLQDGKKTYHLIVTFDTAAFNELSTEAGEQQSR